jgi:hypothetical protein
MARRRRAAHERHGLWREHSAGGSRRAAGEGRTGKRKPDGGGARGRHRRYALGTEQRRQHKLLKDGAAARAAWLAHRPPARDSLPAAERCSVCLQDVTPLHVVAHAGHLDCMQLLLERGADKNAPTKARCVRLCLRLRSVLSQCECSRCPLLHLTCLHGCADARGARCAGRRMAPHRCSLRRKRAASSACSCW